MGSWGITAFQSDAGLDALGFIREQLPKNGKLELDALIYALRHNRKHKVPDVTEGWPHTSPMALAELMVKYMDGDLSGLDYDEGEPRRFGAMTSFTASKESLHWLKNYLADTLQYARENAELSAKRRDGWAGWVKEQDWLRWQEHMAALIGRVEALLALPGERLDLLALPEQGQIPQQEQDVSAGQIMEEHEPPIAPLAQVTLTLRNNDQLQMGLPLRMEEVLQRSASYYLAYGQAEVAFNTPDLRLNSELNRCVQQASDISLQELNTLAQLLSRLDAQRLSLLGENLPAEPCACAELTRRACYFGRHYLRQDGEPDPQAIPLEAYDYNWDRSRLAEGVSRKFRRELEAARLTGGQLFQQVLERARENGDFAQAAPICDYTLADSRHEGKLCRYEFDFVPIVNFGGSEGVYIDCGLRGKLDESGRDSIHVGTIKTLDNDLAACKIMGELCGALLYHENQYVNENLLLFDRTEAIENMLSRPLNMAPAMSMEAQEQEFGQQMC